MTSFVSAKNTLTVNPVKNVNEKQTGKLEMTCCTRTGTATISDGEGNSNTTVRTVTGCSNNTPSMAELCSSVQKEANQKALKALNNDIN